VSGSRDTGVVEEAFHDMNLFWRQSHHVRALGDYLLAGVRLSQLFRQTRRAMTVTIGTGDNKNEIVFGGA
jgi:hypothetical protein